MRHQSLSLWWQVLGEICTPSRNALQSAIAQMLHYGRKPRAITAPLRTLLTLRARFSVLVASAASLFSSFSLFADGEDCFRPFRCSAPTNTTEFTDEEHKGNVVASYIAHSKLRGPCRALVGTLA